MWWWCRCVCKCKCKQILMLILMWQSSYNNLVVLNVKAILKPPSLTGNESGLLNKPPSLTNNRVGIKDLGSLEAAEMFKCSVSGTGFD
jgi:hypothetical protein